MQTKIKQRHGIPIWRGHYLSTNPDDYDNLRAYYVKLGKLVARAKTQVTVRVITHFTKLNQLQKKDGGSAREAGGLTAKAPTAACEP